MPRMTEFCAVLHQVLMVSLYHRKLEKLQKRTEVVVLGVKEFLCNTLSHEDAITWKDMTNVFYWPM